MTLTEPRGIRVEPKGRLPSGRPGYDARVPAFCAADVPEVTLPDRLDLLPPRLLALRLFGDSATNDELDQGVIDLMGLTTEQVAVEYPPKGDADRLRGPAQTSLGAYLS